MAEPSGIPLKLWIGFLAMSGGTFMAILDIQIVVSSLPRIGSNLSATIDEASWIQTAYIISEVIMIPIAGWLARALSIRYLYTIACTLFTFMSVACSTAWSLESLIFFRILQGLAGGAMIPMLYIALYTLFPRERQGSLTLFVVLIIAMAPTIGPTLGGWISDTYTWRWLFLINILPGIVVTSCVFTCLEDDGPQFHLLRHFDLVGILLIASFIGCVQYVLEEGSVNDWLDSPRITLFAIAALLSGIFGLWRELTIDHPVVNLRAFTNRNFATGCFFNFVMGMALYSSGYLMTMMLATVRGFGSFQIGRVLAVPGMAMIVSIPFVSLIVRKLGLRISLCIGLIIFGTALGWNGHLTSQVGFDQAFWPQVLRGASLMLCVTPVTRLALGTLPREDVSNASSLYSLMRNLGGAIGIALTSSLHEYRLAFHGGRLAELLTPTRIPVRELYRSMESQQDLLLLAQMAGREANMLAFNDLWLILCSLVVLILLLTPMVRNIPSPSQS